VTPKLRALCQQTWGTPITDIYSSQELGYIALQCPVSGQYHAMAETVLVEILNAKGEPCAPGEIGRLVISSLHNFAMPLIRYELRDYAEAGGVCACGRGLPTIARILGRSRNLLTLPNGEQRWPLVGFAEYRAVAPIRQYQLIQHTLEEIEVRLVADRPLTTDEEAQLTQVIQRALGWAFRLRFVYFDGEIPRTAGGKFEEFVSNIGA
jgi:phenylacetate-CoA ligase